MHFIIFDDKTKKPVRLGQIVPGVPLGFENIVSLFPTSKEAETVLDYSIERQPNHCKQWFIIALGENV